MINGVFLPKKRRFCFFKNRIRGILTKSFLTIIVKKRAFVKKIGFVFLCLIEQTPKTKRIQTARFTNLRTLKNVLSQCLCRVFECIAFECIV